MTVISGSLEGDRIDEEIVSKTIGGDEPFAGAIPVPSVAVEPPKTVQIEAIKEQIEAVKEKVKKPVVAQKLESKTGESASTYYKLNYRTAQGGVRAEISRSILYQVGSKWGDLLNIIPSTRWATLEEIVQVVWEWEKRHPHASLKRSRKQIEEGVEALVAARILLTK